MAPGDTYHGSRLAGPVFKAVADRVYVTHSEWQTPVSKSIARATRPPDMKGGPMSAVREVARELEVKLETDARRRDWVSTRADSLEIVAKVSTSPRGAVPSVVGFGLKDAIFALENRGFRVEISGRGRVTEQSPAPGTPTKRGGTVNLVLR
jgi:cell division protein FtsI (penicillin-binding protein 3)